MKWKFVHTPTYLEDYCAREAMHECITRFHKRCDWENRPPWIKLWDWIAGKKLEA